MGLHATGVCVVARVPTSPGSTSGSIMSGGTLGRCRLLGRRVDTGAVSFFSTSPATAAATPSALPMLPLSATARARCCGAEPTVVSRNFASSAVTVCASREGRP